MPPYLRQPVSTIQMCCFRLDTSSFAQKMSPHLISMFQQLNNSKNVCQEQGCQNNNHRKEHIWTLKIGCREYSSIRPLRVNFLLYVSDILEWLKI